MSFSEHNPKAGIIDTICKAVVQCLEWDKTRFIPEFNRLFCISNAHADFLKVAEYWCGEDGVAWRSEYDEMEDLCKNMIPALEYFGENKFIEEVREKQKYRMFGYVGRKDYSLNGFNDNTWNLLFENIVTRFAESDYGIIASLWGDFTIFSIYYLSRIDKDKIKALFDCLCKTHESLSSANGRVKIKEEKLILDENITSLSDMVNFQLNI